MAAVYTTIPEKKKNILEKISMNTTLIIINVAVFIIFNILALLKLTDISIIALQPSKILKGEHLWTFLTSMFMHGGIFHILANMVSLFFIGSLTEKILGAKRYLWFYLASGLFAGIFFVLSSLIFTSDYNALAVGASGALFGVVGLMMLLTPNLPVYMMFIPIPVKMKYAAPIMLALLWVVSILADIGIGNTAHLGGLIFGLIFGLYLKNKYKNKTAFIKKMFS